MKKLYLSIIALAIVHTSFAQWTTSGNDIYNANTGKVGIGTTSPGAKLDVNGNGNYAGALQIGGTAVNSNSTKLFINNGLGKNWALSSGANMITEQGFCIYNWTDNPTQPLLYITNDGSTSINNALGATLLLRKSSTNIPALTFQGAVSSTIIEAGDDFLTTTLGGQRRFTILSNGNVGIGTTTPQSLLQINNQNGSGATGLIVYGGDTGVGTTIANFLDYYGASKMYIRGDGNIGIGTATPGYKLESVTSDAGTNNITYPLSVDHLSSGAVTGGFGSGINFESQNYIGTPIDAGRIRVYQNTTNTTKMTFSTIYGFNNFVDAMTLFNGNVGIGTTSPENKLDVNGTVSSGVKDYSINSATYQLTNQSNVDGISGVSPTGAFRWYTNPNNSWSGGFLYQLRAFDTTNGESGGLLTVRGDGAVLIGAAAIPAGYKLAVAGNAIAESMTVKLQTNWPDVVFKKDYTLMPLSEVKTYIDKNQHLPEIPAAAEVEKDGVNLGEMNRLLVKKVEELTLYLIEKDKQEKRQQQQIDELKKQMETLLVASRKNP